MDIFRLFFEVGPAIQFIFKLDYIPQPEDFKELTTEQYAALRRRADSEDIDMDADSRIYVFVPDDPMVYNRLVELNGDNLTIVKEEEIEFFKDAETTINNLCRDCEHHLETLQDKLVYLAGVMPGVFTEGTPYEIYHAVKNIKRE